MENIYYRIMVAGKSLYNGQNNPFGTTIPGTGSTVIYYKAIKVLNLPDTPNEFKLNLENVLYVISEIDSKPILKEVVYMCSEY